jgi:hypothetical protein
LGLGCVERRRRVDSSCVRVNNLNVHDRCDLFGILCTERVAILADRLVVADGCLFLGLRKSCGYGEGSFGIRCGDKRRWKWKIENEPELSEIGIPV